MMGGYTPEKREGGGSTKKAVVGGGVEGVEGNAARETKWGNERSMDAVLAFLLQWCDGAISLRRSRGQLGMKKTWRKVEAKRAWEQLQEATFMV